MKTTRIVATSVVTGLGMLLAALPVAAQQFTYSSWTPPPAPNNRLGTVPMFETITEELAGSPDAITFNNYMGGQLFSAFTTLPALRDGVVDGGIIVPSYNAAELRTHTALGELQALATEGYAAAAAGTETLLRNCPDCLAEYAGQNVYPLGVYATAPYHLMCNFEVTSMADLQGRRGAEGNPMFNRWAAALGMSRQSLPPNEFQQALQRGSVDCVFAPKDWLVAYSLADVVTSIVNDTSHGVFPAVVMMAVNRNSWDSKLSEAQREAITREIPGALMNVVRGYYDDEARGEAAALEQGAVLVDLGEEYANAWAAFQEGERAQVIAAAQARGADAEAAVDANIALLAEWEEIVAELGSDPSALAERLYERVFADLSF